MRPNHRLKVFLQRVMLWTTSIVKRSPQQAPAAWLHWMLNVTSTLSRNDLDGLRLLQP
jgi:hypothetical protein